VLFRSVSLSASIMSDRLSEFQRNASFVGFSLLVCIAASVFLARDLRGVIIPLIWAAFFALPICGCISKVEDWLVLVYTRCQVKLHGGTREALLRVYSDDLLLAFESAAGQNHVTVGRGRDVDELLRRVNRPLGFVCCRRSKVGRIPGCCRRRVRLAALSAVLPSSTSEDCETDLGPEVNRLVEGWTYYVRDVSGASGDCTSTEASGEGFGTVDLELFLDNAEAYPAVLDDGEVPQHLRIKGLLQVERSSTFSWTSSFIVVMALLLVAIAAWCSLLGLGITALIDNVHAYQVGISEIGKWVIDSLRRFLPESTLKIVEDKFQNFVKDGIPALASMVVSHLEVVMCDFLLFLIYLGFWIFDPLPIDKEVSRVFRSYLLLKTLVCALFGSCMGLLLCCLDCPLWPLFWIMTFLLNYIPEVGALLSAFLSVPAVLFDGGVPFSTRCWRTVWLVIFGTLFKVVTGNVIEVHMYSTQGGQFMRMHPVILMGMMMLCYSLMGVSGMFLAVPIVATLKFYLVAANMPRAFLNPLLILIEGDVTSPHRNFVDTHKMKVCRGRAQLVTVGEESESLQLSLLAEQP